MRRTIGHHTITALLALAPAVMPVSAAANQGGQAPTPRSGESVTAAVLDPSLRSALASQTFEVAAEVADDKKQVAAKIGFPLIPGLSGEAGFIAAFDHDDVAESQPASLRRLTDGSSLWGAATWVPSRANRRAAPFLGTRVEISRDEFAYYDQALASHTDAHPAYAVTATTGVLLPRDALVAVNYRWMQSWHVGGDSRACGPQSGAVVCPVDRIFRVPSPQPRQQLEAQVQAHLGDRIGAGVFVTRDFRDDVWGFEAPVYFIVRRDSGFTGGLVLNYNGYDGRFDVSLFVGQIFRVFK